MEPSTNADATTRFHLIVEADERELSGYLPGDREYLGAHESIEHALRKACLELSVPFEQVQVEDPGDDCLWAFVEGADGEYPLYFRVQKEV